MLVQVNYTQPQPYQPSPSLGEVIVGAAVVGLALWGVAELLSSNTDARRACGVCGRMGHDRRTCPYDGERASFSRSIPSWTLRMLRFRPLRYAAPSYTWKIEPGRLP